MLVASKGYVCRLCNCFLLDEQRVSIHCQTAAHYINYTTMTKMKDATSGAKKRGIEQVLEEEVNKDENLAKDGDDASVVNNEDVKTQDTETDSEVCISIIELIP